MFGSILNFILQIFGFWKSLPEESKEKIVEAVSELFDDVLRAYYRKSKDCKEG